MIKLLPAIIGCLALFGTSATANNLLKTQNQKSSYVIGVEYGKQLMVSKDDIDIDAIVMGMKDVFENAKPKLTDEEMRNAMTTYQDSVQRKEKAMLKKLTRKNKKESLAYLEENSKKEGVVTLPSGLQYKVLKSGDGKKSPRLKDMVVTHYHGTLIDGTVFDSSYARGKTIMFPVDGVIKGWSEALMKMKVGDKWQLVIPSELAYGERGAAPKIAPGATLLFDLELLEIK